MVIKNTRKVLITCNNNKEKVEFIINPREISDKDGNLHKKVTLLEIGEQKIAGSRGLRTLQLDTFLPSKKSVYYKGRNPLDELKKLKKWKNSKNIVRIIVSKTDINTTYLIDSITAVYKEGDEDIYVSIAAEEKKIMNNKEVSQKGKTNKTTGLKVRGSSKEIPKKVTIKKGMTLWNLAAKYYGSGAKWTKIATANKITNQNKLKVGMVLVMPK